MRISTLALALAAPLLLASATPPKPEDEFAGLVKAYLTMSQPPEWEAIEALPGIKWAPLPPTSLKNCLPNGDCFARQGNATVGGRTMTIVATGARTMVIHSMIRNTSAPLGGPAIVAALKAAGFSADLARCPIRAGSGTEWYRLTGAGASPGHPVHPAPHRGPDQRGLRALRRRRSCPPCSPTSSRSTPSSAPRAPTAPRSRPPSRTKRWPRSSWPCCFPPTAAWDWTTADRPADRHRLDRRRPQARRPLVPERPQPHHAVRHGRVRRPQVLGHGERHAHPGPRPSISRRWASTPRASTCWAWCTRRASRCGWCAAGRSTPSPPTTGTASRARGPGRP